jgi:lysophospholipase L1-like esterase
MKNRLLFVALVAAASFVSPIVAQENKTPKTTDSSFAIPSTDEGLPGSGPIRRYDWFQKLWLSKRLKWKDQIEAQQGSLVFFGDSITQGWGDDFKGKFPGTKLANRGISGDTTRGMLIRLEQDVLSLRPSGIVMLMGTNDLEEQAEPQTIANNLELILARIKMHDPKLPVVLCLVFPSSESKKRPASKIQEINKLYLSNVKGDPQVTVIDTWSLFASPEGDAQSEEFPDLLHPNDRGYQKWSTALRPILETLRLVPPNDGPMPTMPDGFKPLFNGRDLTGWCLRPTPESDRAARQRWMDRDPKGVAWPLVEKLTDLGGMVSSPDGRYLAQSGRIIVTTPAEGRRIQQLWTIEEFAKDFEFRLEFRATPNADSGVFLRGKQLQCRDYLLAGPYKSLTRYKPQDWNELVIVVKNNSARCTCNGELLEEAFGLPESGPIGLEGDRGQVEYRNLWIKASN